MRGRSNRGRYKPGRPLRAATQLAPRRGSNILVLIGANGFLGRHLCERLARRGEPATLVSANPDTAFFERLAPSMKILDAAAFDGPAGDEAIAGAKAVVYFRWRSVPASFAGEPWKELSENVIPAMGVFSRIAHISPAARIVFLSSGGTVYGAGAAPHSESAPTQPISSHGLGKLLGEEALKYVSRTAGNPCTILRISNAVGRWQSNDLQGIVGMALRRAYEGRPVRLFGDGRQVRDFVDADDVARAIELASTDTAHHTRLWNVGSGKGLAIVDAIARISAVTGQEVQVEHAAPRRIDVPVSVLDCRRIAEDLGWRAEIPFEQSILGMWQAVQSARPAVRR